jgi:hypothetical protein
VPAWQVVVLVWLAVVLIAGVSYLVADRRGWIKSERLRQLLRRAYGLDRDRNDEDEED